MPFFWILLSVLPLSAETLPVRGIHLAAPRPAEMPLALKFVREALPKEGANTLVLEINYRYQYASHPTVADPDALSPDDLRQLAQAAREAGVRLIPMINLLGHQSWSKTTFGLLRAYPEFDETPNLYPNNEGIYCRSYCPLHPEVHKVVFALVDELMAATQASAFHAGMDEVFLLGEDACPRCRGRNKAELLAGEIKAIHAHLKQQNRELWLWGDRLLDGPVTGVGKWEGSANDTAAAINMIPRDIVISDWHYEAAHPTALYFALHGFPVVSSPWRKPQVALRQLDLIRHARLNASPPVRDRMLGVLQTTWTGFGRFAQAYFNEPNPDPRAVEAALCFKELFRELRAGARE